MAVVAASTSSPYSPATMSKGVDGEDSGFEVRPRASSLPGQTRPAEGRRRPRSSFMSSLRRRLQGNSLRRQQKDASRSNGDGASSRLTSPVHANGVRTPGGESNKKDGEKQLQQQQEEDRSEKSADEGDQDYSVLSKPGSSAPASTCASHESVADAGRADRPPLAGPKPPSMLLVASCDGLPTLPRDGSLSPREPIPEPRPDLATVALPTRNSSTGGRRPSVGIVAATDFEDNVYENTAALVNAFGPMRDVGRWYSAYQQHRRLSLSDGAQPPAGALSRELRLLEPAPQLDEAAPGAEEGIYETVPSGDDPTPIVTLSNNVRDLAQCSWYWGPVSRSEAEKLLADQKDGTFLVRDSSDDRYLLSLTFRSQGRTLHTRIEHHLGRFSFYAINSGNYDDGFSSVEDLIGRSIQDSQDGAFCFSRQRNIDAPSIPVRLTVPFSRRNVVRSLQHICRFVIRQHTRYDLIRELPLPTMVKKYIEQPSVLQ